MAEVKFKHISVGNDYSLWAVGKSDDTIYRFVGDESGSYWEADKVGKAEVIAAVNRGNIWCVNRDHEIWQLENADRWDAEGTWTQVPTHSGQPDAKTIAVGRDGSICYVGMDGTIYRRFGDAEAVGWVPDKVGKAESLAVVDWGNVWCVNKDHEIWKLENAESLDTGGTWTQVGTHSGKSDAATIAVGYDGVFYVQTDGTLIETIPPGVMSPVVGHWRVASRPGKVDVVAAASVEPGGVDCLTTDGKFWSSGKLWGKDDGEWIHIQGQVIDADNNWQYTVKLGDTLMAIVRREFNLKDPQNTGEINLLVDRIVAQNPGITRDRIMAGEVLKLND